MSGGQEESLQSGALALGAVMPLLLCLAVHSKTMYVYWSTCRTRIAASARSQKLYPAALPSRFGRGTYSPTQRFVNSPVTTSTAFISPFTQVLIHPSPNSAKHPPKRSSRYLPLAPVRSVTFVFFTASRAAVPPPS